MNYKKDFPIFANNKGLVFLDNGASTQKPSVVIDGVSDFVAHDYANIHRGSYALSERSEEAYHDSKEAVAKFLNCKSGEVIYSYNSTYGINLVAQSLVNSGILKKGDVVLLGIWDHHSDILPWQILSKQFGFEIKFLGIDKNYDIDFDDFAEKYSLKVKVVACSHVSNVTGKIYDVKKLGEMLHEDTFFLIDGSQAVPNFGVNVKDIGCDCYVFTGHKLMAYTGIGVVYLERDSVRRLNPMIVGGGTVQDVTQQGHVLTSGPSKFEAGTPNIIGAVSLLKSLEYIDSIGGMTTVWKHEYELMEYALKKWKVLIDKGLVELVGPQSLKDRVGVFSFVVNSVKNFQLVGEKFAAKNIAVRCGGHCAYPLHKVLDKQGTCRMSMYLYNDKEDVDKFFEVLEKICK